MLNNVKLALRNEGNYNELKDELMSLWTEYYADATPGQVKELKTINQNISKAIHFKNKNIRDRRKWIYFDNKFKNAIYGKWLFLKTMEKAQGSGKAYVDAGADDWE